MSNGDSITTRGFGYLRRRAFDWVAEVGRIAMLVGDTFRSLGRGMRSFHLLVDADARHRRPVADGWCSSSACSSAPWRRCRRPTSSRRSCRSSTSARSSCARSSSSSGPVLTALIVGGRVGAAIAAELGTMRSPSRSTRSRHGHQSRALPGGAARGRGHRHAAHPDHDRQRHRHLRRLRRRGHQRSASARTPT